jgi:hypothetical protein
VSAERRLSARVIREDEDNFLSSTPFDLEDEDIDDIVNNRKPDLRLDEGNLTEKANSNIDDSIRRAGV